MNGDDQYKKFKLTIEQLKRTAREDYERRVRALDAALAAAEEILLRTDPAPASGPSGLEPGWTVSQSRKFVLKKEVRRVVKEQRGRTFTQRQVTRKLCEGHPEATIHPASVASALSRLAREGEVEVLKESNGGSDPIVYQEATMSP
jgi:hypothetical protein